MARVGPEDHQEAIDHDDGEAHQQNELLMIGPADEMHDKAALQTIAHNEEQRRQGRHGEEGVDLQGGEENEGAIHANDGEFAMGEIHHAHHAENHRQAQRHQAIDEPRQHALNEHFKNEGQRHS